MINTLQKPSISKRCIKDTFNIYLRYKEDIFKTLLKKLIKIITFLDLKNVLKIILIYLKDIRIFTDFNLTQFFF